MYLQTTYRVTLILARTADPVLQTATRIPANVYACIQELIVRLTVGHFNVYILVNLKTYGMS